MALSDDIRQVLYRNRAKSPRQQVLAVLSAVQDNRPATRDWLKRYASSDEVKSFASDDTKWTRAVKDASTYLSKSLLAVRRDTSRRLISHSLRSFSCTPARARKARLLAAIVGARLLADPRGWDTTILNLEDLATLLGITPKTAAGWLKIATAEDVLSLRGKTRNGEHRVALRRWPTSHKPTAVEQAASASILDGEPNIVARWVLSAPHPAWHFDAVKVTDETPANVNVNALTQQAWEASVFWSAGLKTPRGQMRKRLAPLTDPLDLDLRLDAVQRAAEATAVRDVERAEYAARQIARKEAKNGVRSLLASWGWTPEAWPKGDEGAAERMRLLGAFVTRCRAEMNRILDPNPLLLDTIARNLRAHFPDPADAESAIDFIRKDFFDEQ